MFQTEVRESFADDGPSLPYMSNVQDNASRREVVERAVRDQRTKSELQDSLDTSRRQRAEAEGFQRQKVWLNGGDKTSSRMPNVRPDKLPSVRESIYAALEEHKIPRQRVDDVDSITGSVKTSFQDPLQDRLDKLDDIESVRLRNRLANNIRLQEPPAHWNVHPAEFRALPVDTRQEIHNNQQAIAEGTAHRNAIANPRSAPDYLRNLGERFKLSPQQQQEGARWLNDPHREPVRIPEFKFAAPPGYAQMSSTMRDAIWQEQKSLHVWNWINHAMGNEQTRLLGYKLLSQEYQHVNEIFRQEVARLPQSGNPLANYTPQQIEWAINQLPPDRQPAAKAAVAENTVLSWAVDKVHFKAKLPVPGGGTVLVSQLMGMALQQGLAKPSQGDPAGLNAAYNLITKAAERDGLLYTPRPERKQRRASSMRGGAPASPPPPQPQYAAGSVRGDIVNAIRELQGA